MNGRLLALVLATAFVCAAPTASAYRIICYSQPTMPIPGCGGGAVYMPAVPNFCRATAYLDDVYVFKDTEANNDEWSVIVSTSVSPAPKFSGFQGNTGDTVNLGMELGSASFDPFDPPRGEPETEAIEFDHFLFDADDALAILGAPDQGHKAEAGPVLPCPETPGTVAVANHRVKMAGAVIDGLGAQTDTFELWFDFSWVVVRQ